jgi:hypothetical protein
METIMWNFQLSAEEFNSLELRNADISLLLDLINQIEDCIGRQLIASDLFSLREDLLKKNLDSVIASLDAWIWNLNN